VGSTSARQPGILPRGDAPPIGPSSNAGDQLVASVVGDVADEPGVSTNSEWPFNSIDGEQGAVELLRRPASGDATPVAGREGPAGENQPARR
jgi:hypothetical protein